MIRVAGGCPVCMGPMRFQGLPHISQFYCTDCYYREISVATADRFSPLVYIVTDDTYV